MEKTSAARRTRRRRMRRLGTPPAGPRVVFLPGTLCNAQLFGPQLLHFSALGWRQFLWDYGDFRAWDDWAEDALARMPPDFALVGLSLGGIAAMEIVRRAPERVTHLALLDTNLSGDSEASAAQRDADLLKACELGLSRFAAEELVPRQLHPDHAADSWFREALPTMARKIGMRRWRAQLDLLSDRRDARPLLPAVRVPALVGCGDADRVCPPELHREIADLLPNATLEIFPRCGHLSTLEDGDGTTAALTRLLQK